ncbi:MAG: helix-turn-helix transcriptional regulator [Clostridia bacterium]|nr:helix-turn-helix transcriptional regulator [Clostridia bacterium]
MTTGQKIKSLRKEKGLTQNALAAGIITRNMLSLIESDAAKPSLSTAKALAQRLGVSIEYIISDTSRVDDLTMINGVKEMRELFKAKDYKGCLQRSLSLSSIDDETALIVMKCGYIVGEELFRDRHIKEAMVIFENALQCCEKTAYATSEEISRIRRAYLLSEAIVEKKNFYDIPKYITAPIDEIAAYVASIYNVDIGNIELTQEHKNHIYIIKLVKSGRYGEAKKALLEKLQYVGDELTKYYMLRTLEDVYRKTEDYKGSFETLEKKSKSYDKLVKS